MSSAGSVTRWMKKLREGESDAATPLWERYFHRLAALARAKLGGAKLGPADQGDVALSAFFSFCKGLEQGRFADLKNRDELWRLLVVITRNKAVDLLRRQFSATHGEGKVRGEAWLNDMVAQEPSPEFVAELVDEYRHLLDILHDEDGTLRFIAVQKSEGYTSREIASKLGIAVRSVERKFKLICVLWGEDLERRFGGDSS